MKKILKEQTFPQGVTDPEAMMYYPELQAWQKNALEAIDSSRRNEMVKKYKANNESLLGKGASKLSGAADIAMTPLTKWMPKLAGIQSVNDKELTKIIVSESIPLPTYLDYPVLQCILDPNEKQTKQLLLDASVLEEQKNAEGQTTKLFIIEDRISNTPFRFYYRVAQLVADRMSTILKFTGVPTIAYTISRNEAFKNNVYNILKKYAEADIMKFTKKQQRESLKKYFIDDVVEYANAVSQTKKQLPTEKFDVIINNHYSLLEDAGTIAPALTVKPSSNTSGPSGKTDPLVKVGGVMSMGSEFQYDRTKSTAPKSPTAEKPKSEEEKKVEKEIALQNVFGGGGAFDTKKSQDQIKAAQQQAGISPEMTNMFGGGTIIGSSGEGEAVTASSADEMQKKYEPATPEQMQKEYEQATPEQKKSIWAKLFGK